MKVYDAVIELIKFKKRATVAEITKMTGKKYPDVVKILNRNRHLIDVVKNGAIIKIYPGLKYAALSAACASGKYYWKEQFNYGSQTEIRFNNNPEAEAMKMTVWCGGMGDCWPYKTVLATEENETALQAIGMRPIEEFDPTKAPEYRPWDEEG
jgi:hypothetical protein